jgi:hypothetical protein
MLTSVYEVHHLVNVLLLEISCCECRCAQTDSTWIQCTLVSWNCIIKLSGMFQNSKLWYMILCGSKMTLISDSLQYEHKQLLVLEHEVWHTYHKNPSLGYTLRNFNSFYMLSPHLSLQTGHFARSFPVFLLKHLGGRYPAHFKIHNLITQTLLEKHK